MADRSESATGQNPTNCDCGSSPAGRRFPSDSHFFGEDPRLAVVVGLLGMPPERVLRDLGEDPFLRIAVSRLALQDDFIPDLSPDERLDEFLHRGDPGGLPSVQLRIIEPNRRPDRDGSARVRITGHEDVLHRPSVQDPSKMDLTLRPELESVGPWIASFFDDPVSDELTKECELLLEVGEWPLGTEPVDRPQRMGSAQPWLLLGHDLGSALGALSPEPSGDGAAGRLITGSGPEGSISSTIAPSLPVRRPSRPRAFVPPHLWGRRRTVVEIRQGHAWDRFPEGSLDAAKVSFVLRSHERDGLPGGLHAGRPSDPVHVVGRDGRNVVVDHVGDALDVDPARRDVRRDEDLVASTSESGESRLPLALTAVPVDSCDVETGLADLPGHAVRAPLRADEDEDRHHVFPAEQADEQGCLQVLGNRVDFVADRRRRPVGRGHGDSDGIAHDRPGERLDLRRHRRGEEEGLSLPREGLHDPADVREEPHVEHPVRLVEDEDLEAAEVDVATGHVVQEPAGCRDDDIDARSEGVLLRRHADAPVDRVAADAGPFREATEGHLDLGGQFAGRREDEGARATRGLLHKSLEDRKEKRGSLPRSRLCGADHIAARQNRGDCLLLDRRGGLVAQAIHGSKQDRVEAEKIEGVLRVRGLHRGSYEFIGLRIPTVDEDAASLILSHDGPRRLGRSRHRYHETRELTPRPDRSRISHPRLVRGSARLCVRVVHGLHARGCEPRRGVVSAEDHRTHPASGRLRRPRGGRGRMELVARCRHVAPSGPLAHGRDRQPPRRDGRLRPVATPGRPDPVRPPMEPTTQSPGAEEAHEGGTGNFHHARMEAVRRRDGTGLPACATPTDEVNARPERGAWSPRRCRRRPAGHAAVIVPKSPSDSSFGPAVKNSVSIGPLLTVPCPNCNAQSPSMTSFRPSMVRSVPMSSNVPSGSSWYAFTWPSPKLPMSRSPPNVPKLAGASARPHGAFNWPCCATRASRFPSVSKASTKPRPWPSISSFAPGPCFAYVTKIRAPIVWIPKGA